MLKQITDNGLEILASGAISGGYSYSQGRTRPTSLLGTRLPEWQVNGIMAMSSSSLGYLTGGYVLPFVLDHVGTSATTQNLARQLVPVGLSGLGYAGGRKYLTDAPSSLGQDFMEGAVSTAIASYVIPPITSAITGK